VRLGLRTGGDELSRPVHVRTVVHGVNCSGADACAPPFCFILLYVMLCTRWWSWVSTLRSPCATGAS
jgi:hypothetical protein